MNRQYVQLISAALVLLSGCGTGGSDSGPPKAGIDGSGNPITASGVVTALGSIVVNDVTYDVSRATVTINDAAASASDLAPGQITVVEGTIDANGVTGVASRVSVEIALAGPISAIDVGHNRTTILGQTVAIDAGTIIEGRAEGNPLGGLDVGRDVAVSGFPDSSGVLHARRIEPRKPTLPLLVTGYVSNVDPGARTFSVNDQVVSYATATLTGIKASALAGASVRISAQRLDQGVLIAGNVSLRDERLPGASGDTAVVQGWVTRFGSESDFDVDGHPVISAATTTRASVVRLDAFVSVSGALIANGVVAATTVKALLPGHIVGSVTIGNTIYGISGLLTAEGAFRLDVGEPSDGPPTNDSGLGQLVGSLVSAGNEASGTAVFIGAGCGLASAGRFCGEETPVRLELTKTGSYVDEGSSGVIQVVTAGGEEVWPVHLGYWGGRAGFDPGLSPEDLHGLYALHQAEFAQDGSVIMSVGGEAQVFFQSAHTGCTGNGAISRYLDGTADVYNVTLRIEGCNGSFAYLNTDFEGLSTLESLTPWDYDFSVQRMWLSTAPGAASPAAITLWAGPVP
jgi:hypothetical protein